MISKKGLSTIVESQRIQQLATECLMDVAIHSPYGTTRVDAKSFRGMFSLDFTQLVLAVLESIQFHRDIHNIGENM